MVTETVGARVRRVRLERGLSLREIESEGATYAYISRIEGGTRQPSVKALRLLAAKLGVTPEYLETGEDRLSVLLDRETVLEALYLFRSMPLAPGEVWLELQTAFREVVTLEELESYAGRAAEPLPEMAVA